MFLIAFLTFQNVKANCKMQNHFAPTKKRSS
nr:MAG TPA: hypothetical protein [Caudoviricetes sp.]